MKTPANRKGLPTIGQLKKEMSEIRQKYSQPEPTKPYKHDSSWVGVSHDQKESFEVCIKTGDFWYAEAEGLILEVVDFDKHFFARKRNEPKYEIGLIRKTDCEIIEN